jgi:hypothetical protein
MSGAPVPEPIASRPGLQPLSVELERTVDRLRSRSLSRLARSWDPAQTAGPTAAQAGVVLAQELADAAAALEGVATRTLPSVEPHVVPDLLAVCGHDLLIALAAAQDRGESPTVMTQLGASAIAGLRRFRSVL